MRPSPDTGEELQSSKVRGKEFGEMRNNQGAGKSLASRGIVYFRTSPGSNGSAVHARGIWDIPQGLGARQSAV